MKVRVGGRGQSGHDDGGFDGGVIANFVGTKRRLSRRQVALAVMTIFVVLVALLIGALINSSLFAISKVRIVIQGKLISSAEVLSYTDSIKGSNYFNVDVGKIARNFDTDPNIGAATVTKTFPNTVTIDLVSAKAFYDVLTNFTTLSRVALNGRGQPLPGVSPPVALPIICSSRAQVFTDSASDFSCSPMTNVADVQVVLGRISSIISSWSLSQSKILSIYVFNGYGVGVEDSRGDLIYYADANSVANSSAVLARIFSTSQLPRPFLIDLSYLKSPFYLSVPAFKG